MTNPLEVAVDFAHKIDIQAAAITETIVTTIIAMTRSAATMMTPLVAMTDAESNGNNRGTNNYRGNHIDY